MLFAGAQFQGGELPVGIFDLPVSLQRNLSRRKNQHQHKYQHDAYVRQQRNWVTDNYGGMWNYTYDGTVTTTTTTTTTTHDDLPYTDTSSTLYLRSYDQNGRVISERWRTITTRQGGDGANTLGYNLGAALGAIHMKQHLLKNVVEDVTKGPK